MPTALGHDPKSAWADPLRPGEGGAFDLGADSRTGVQVEIMLLGLALRILRRFIRMVLHVQPTCS